MNQLNASTERRYKVCVCTSYAADREPRGPRHALAIWETGNCGQLTFVDLRPGGQPRVDVNALAQIPSLRWRSIIQPTRTTHFFKWAIQKVDFLLSRKLFKLTGFVRNSALNPSLTILRSILVEEAPDLIVAHNIDTLLPAYEAARAVGARLIFDSMEYHSAMGYEQDQLDAKIIRNVETRTLPECDLILTSSSEVAAALKETYGVRRLVALENVPSVTHDLCTEKADWLSLYWRNSTIGLGQRGLEEALRALPLLPPQITLHLQGRKTEQDHRAVLELAESLDVTRRVIFHPPYRAEQAIREASRFHVGLCLERSGVRNHELTVSNKMYDYHMAGLAVVASDMPSLSRVLAQSQGGLLYRAGDAKDLARVIRKLFDDTDLYSKFSQSARRFALDRANVTAEMAKFKLQLCSEVITHRNRDS